MRREYARRAPLKTHVHGRILFCLSTCVHDAPQLQRHQKVNLKIELSLAFAKNAIARFLRSRAWHILAWIYTFLWWQMSKIGFGI